MAPPKTMAISQQQQQQQPMSQVDQQAGKQAKPRKRRAKQQQQQQQPQPQPQPAPQVQALAEQQVKSKPSLKSSSNGQEKVTPVVETIAKQPQSPAVVPNERTTVKGQQQNQVPTTVKEIRSETKRPVPVIPEVSPATAITKHHQLAPEEADDVDAGIELDGSSNSSSSVKDINEDQLKSTSVSPIMAQTSLIVNESCPVSSKQPIEVTSVEQLTSSLCSAATPSKKISTTKQQLAANQQVIDADEQLLQEKLQNKQRKLSASDVNSSAVNESQVGNKKVQVNQSGGEKSTRVRRSFSSQSSQEEGSLCKVCEQHVYQMERMLAEKSVYHKRCFRCYQCKIQLRVDNYSSHEGQVYCKAHHRQIFQPQVKLDSEEDVDIVAKSTSQPVDDYLLHRGRLSKLSFSFLQPNPQEIRKRQMIICENEPTELPDDVVRSDTKLDDGIQQLNLNLSNILEKFERGTANNGDEVQPNSAGLLIEKPSINIKQTLKAFESKFGDDSINSSKPERSIERPVVKKLANLNGFFKTSMQVDDSSPAPVRPLAVRRSESLMMRLKKYESRIAGEQVDDEDSDGDENNNKEEVLKPELSKSGTVANAVASVENSSKERQAPRPKKLPSIDLSSLKNQWETGDINKARDDDDDDESTPKSAGDKNFNGNSPSVEKNEELLRIRQQLAQKSGESGSIRNIYENAIKEAQLQSKQQASRRDSSDLSALNGFSTTGIQQQLLQNSLNGNSSNNGQNVKTPTTPNKDHFQLNLNNKANKLKEKFELGLITNSSQDDSDQSVGDDSPALSKLEQLRQEKMEDLSVFTDGEIKAREARSIFQQMDRRISAAAGGRQPKVHSRSLAAIGDSMRTKLTNQMNTTSLATNHNHQNQPQEQQPIRLTNNVRI